jgi:ferric-dicitrate binding protein FerR (iron transport regulator)
MMRRMFESADVHVPRELDAALRDRVDGIAMRAVYDAVGRDAPTAGEVSAAEHEAAWARLSRRLNDPDRVPFRDDVPPMLELVSDEPDAGDLTLSAVAPAVPPVVSAARREAFSTARLRRIRFGLRGVAAAAVLLLGLGIGWGSGQRSVHNAAGSRTVVVPLADGSRVWLAPGSTLSHPRRWALFRATGLNWLAPNARRVTLRGDAFFAVARDGRPFTVATGDAEVRVLGTRFLVRAAHAGHGTRVQVEEGRVAVSHAASRVELSAGDAANVMGAGLASYKILPSRVALAAQGGMAAIDEPLGEVFDMLSRRYGVQIERSARVNLVNSVSFFFPNEPDIETVLGDLCAAQGLTYTRSSRGYRIDRP